MLFASLEFIFLFLPVALLGYFAIGRLGPTKGILWLFGVSLFFYGWWNPKYLILLITSILVNYFVGKAIVRSRDQWKARWAPNLMFALGLSFNLGLLIYYKYFDFLESLIYQLLGRTHTADPFFLPLGISFFTFTQIAFLVDMKQGAKEEKGFFSYALFVTYFPHLIAGPFLNYRDMGRQFKDEKIYFFNPQTFSVGLFIFSIGLFKKVLFADPVSVLVEPVFSMAATNHLVDFFSAWKGALAYTLQLYFDFSGYSDMAVGISLLFGIKLPINFFSPFKSCSIIDFWKTWHMTLSAFIQDYLFTPLVRSFVIPRLAAKKIKKMKSRHIVLPVVVSMTICGLWHGANTTFIVFGFLHGSLLAINHLWRDHGANLKSKLAGTGVFWTCIAWALTFTSVVVCFVVFRAPNLDTAKVIIAGLFRPSWEGPVNLADFRLIFILLVVALGLPNAYQLTREQKPTLKFNVPASPWGRAPTLQWSPQLAWSLAGSFLAALSIIWLILAEKSVEFLYFQF